MVWDTELVQDALHDFLQCTFLDVALNFKLLLGSIIPLVVDVLILCGPLVPWAKALVLGSWPINESLIGDH